MRTANVIQAEAIHFMHQYRIWNQNQIQTSNRDFFSFRCSLPLFRSVHVFIGHLGAIRLLLPQNKLNIDAKNIFGFTPLMKGKRKFDDWNDKRKNILLFYSNFVGFFTFLPSKLPYRVTFVVPKLYYLPVCTCLLIIFYEWISPNEGINVIFSLKL